MGIRGFFQDEQGALSLGRILLTSFLAFIAFLVLVDTFLKFEVPAPAYALLGGLATGLLAWVGGPRIAQYIAPQIGVIAQGVGAAARRMARTDDRYEDDERG